MKYTRTHILFQQLPKPVHVLISNSSATINVSLTKKDTFVNSTCRLVHADSGKEYDLNDHIFPARGIMSYRPSFSKKDVPQCGASIKINNLRFGNWYLEERSELNILRSLYHFISIFM